MPESPYPRRFEYDQPLSTLDTKELIEDDVLTITASKSVEEANGCHIKNVTHRFKVLNSAGENMDSQVLLEYMGDDDEYSVGTTGYVVQAGLILNKGEKFQTTFMKTGRTSKIVVSSNTKITPSSKVAMAEDIRERVAEGSRPGLNPDLYDVPLKNLPMSCLRVGNILRMKTAKKPDGSQSVYEFEVIGEIEGGVQVKYIGSNPQLLKQDGEGREGNMIGQVKLDQRFSVSGLIEQYSLLVEIIVTKVKQTESVGTPPAQTIAPADTMSPGDQADFASLPQGTPLKKSPTVEIETPPSVSPPENPDITSVAAEVKAALLPHNFEYNTPLKEIPTKALNVGDILCIKTSSKSSYEFTVTKKDDTGVFIKPVEEQEGWDGAYIRNETILTTKPLFFADGDDLSADGGNTSVINEFEIQHESQRSEEPIEYGKDILFLPPEKLNVGNVLVITTGGRGSVYHFEVTAKEGEKVRIKCTQGSLGIKGKEAYIDIKLIKKGWGLAFGGLDFAKQYSHTSYITDMQVMEYEVEETRDETLEAPTTVWDGRQLEAPEAPEESLESDPDRLEVGQIITIRTKNIQTGNFSIYEFQVINKDEYGKDGERVLVKCIAGNAVLHGRSGYIKSKTIKKGEQFAFGRGIITSPIDDFEIGEISEITSDSMIFEKKAEDGVSLVEVDTNDLEIDDVINIQTTDLDTGHNYYFQLKVLRKDAKGIYIQCYTSDNTRLDNIAGYINSRSIMQGEDLFFGNSSIDFPIFKFTVSRPGVTDSQISDGSRTDPGVVGRTGPMNTEGLVERIEDMDVITAIGDSNGSYETYLWNMQGAGLINGKGRWIGGSKTVVVHGDILADRSADGFQILEKNRALRKEAQKHGGNIILLAGNHDDFMLSFLLQRGGCHDNGFWCMPNQMLGMLELTKFTGDDSAISEKLSDMFAMNHEEILKNMQNSAYGRMLLEEMCQMQLCKQINDTIYVHTDPTNEMLRMLLDKGVDNINGDYRTATTSTLMNGNPYDKDYNKVLDTFLSTGNRTVASPKRDGIDLDTSLLMRLMDNGINQAVFGHSDLGTGNRLIEIPLPDGRIFKLLNVDAGALKGGQKTISVGKVYPDRLDHPTIIMQSLNYPDRIDD